jgi:hypothetical protein
MMAGFLRIIIVMTVKVKVRQSHNTPLEAQGEEDI